MSKTESYFERQEYEELADAFDKETVFLSGGYDRLPTYYALMQIGTPVLPHLIIDIENPRKRGDWWRIQMVCELASTALQQSIIFPEEIRGKHAEVQARVLAWWEADGQHAYLESLNELGYQGDAFIREGGRWWNLYSRGNLAFLFNSLEPTAEQRKA